MNDLFHLIQDEWEARLKANPFLATYVGRHEYNHLVPEVSEAAFATHLVTLRGFKQRWEVLDPNSLSDEDHLNYQLFGYMLDNAIDELRFHTYRLPMNKTNGFHFYLPHRFATQLPARTTQDYENLIARLGALPEYIHGQIEVMRVGLDSGQVPAVVTLDGVAAQIQAQILGDPTSSQFFAPFTRFPTRVSLGDQSRLADAAAQAIQNGVIPAYADLLTFFEQEYLPGAAEEIAATRLPDGEAYYRYCIRYHTTLNLTPAEIHAIGLEEVARIRGEMDAAIAASGFEGDFKAFVVFLRTAPRFYPETAEALLKEAAYIVKRMEGRLPEFFKTLPRMTYGVVPMPAEMAPGNTTARYSSPSGDGTRAGEYWVNTYDLKSRALYEMEALSLHEAVPGHHLQIALQLELDALPDFRRYDFINAYVEGWALYAERLGLETGFYQDPYSNFGRLSFEMWRACRLVVDTGMHALGWSRQQAIDFMLENTSLTPLNVANEVDRYIGWPGQSLGYKLGELRIRGLREKAENALGIRFDLRDFHDLILVRGPLPLHVLEQQVNNWIDKCKTGKN